MKKDKAEQKKPQTTEVYANRPSIMKLIKEEQEFASLKGVKASEHV